MSELFGPLESLRRSLNDLHDEVQAVQDEVHTARAELKEIGNTVSALELEIGGAPKTGVRRQTRQSIRERLHTLESQAAAAKLSSEILKEVRAAHARSWSRWEKVGLFGFAAVAALSSILRLLGVTL